MCLLCLSGSLLVAMDVHAAESVRPKRVLVLSTGSRFSPGFPIVEQNAIDELRKLHAGELEFYSEYLDIVRFPSKSFHWLFRDYLRNKYVDDVPDVIVLVFVGNLVVARRLLDEIFPSTPVVAVGLSEEELSRSKVKQDLIGIVQRSDPGGTIELILRLQPEIERILLIGGIAEVDRQVMAQATKVARSFGGRVEVQVWADRSMDDILEAVRALPPRTAILFTRMFRGGAGRAVNSSQAAQAVAKVSNVPVYVMSDPMLGTGAVGGSVADTPALGKRAGELAELILNGAEPKSLPLEILTQGVPIFDWRALRRWGISESRLPQNSILRYRSVPVWQQHPWYMAGALVIFLLQAGLISGLVVNRLNRRRAEKELRDSQELLETATQAARLGLWARDLNGEYVWVNSVLRDELGFGPNQAVRVGDILGRVHPDDKARIIAEVETAQQANARFEGEFRTLLGAGKEHWVLAKGSTVNGAGGRGVHRMGVLLDITERKKMEAVLRESEENLRLLVENTAAVLWQADMETWRFTYVTPQAVKLLGYPLEQWYEKDFWAAHIHPDDRQLAIDICLTKSQQTEDFEFEYRMIRSSGEVVWVHDIVNCQHKAGAPSQLRGLMLDITARKQSEQAIRESEERFRTVANAAPVMIWMSGADQRFTFFNKGWIDFTGRTLEQEIASGWTEGVHRDDVADCQKTYTQCFNEQREFLMEYRLRRSDGEYRSVVDHGVPRFEADGTFLGFIGTATDISELKSGEAALEKERAFLRQVIDIDPNFIFAKDREGKFTLANRALADAYGTTVENLLGKTDGEFNPNREEVEFFHRMDLEVIDTLQERFIPEERITDAGGKVRWLQTVKRAIVEPDGLAKQVLGASTDITARKVAEVELQRNRDELAHMTRVSTLGELVASLAHELNQPLGAILSNAEAAEMLLKAEPPALEEVGEILADIRSDDQRASEVIRGLRGMLRRQETLRESLPINDAIAEVLRLLSIDAVHRKASLKFEPAANLPLVQGDRVQLQQVILNLVLNAMEAMAGQSEESCRVVVRSAAGENGTIAISVADSGPGIPSDKLPRLFEPFFTTKTAGMGMGLSIARTIVEAHHGKIWAENNAGGGAIFCVTLPVSTDV